MTDKARFGAVILILQLTVFAMVLAMLVLLVRRCAAELSEVDSVIEDHFVEDCARWGDDQAAGNRPSLVGQSNRLVP
jgi:hypothetical protein